MSLLEIARLSVELKNDAARQFAARNPKLIERCIGLRTDRFGAVASAFADSKILIWERDIYELATSNSEAFLGAALTPSMFAAYEPELWVFHDFGQKVPYDLTVHSAFAVLFIPYKTHFTHLWISAPDDGVDPSVTGFAVTGLSLEVGQAIPAMSSRIVAGHEFVRHKIAAKEIFQMPRADRRRMARERKDVPEIRVVQLRGREASVWHGAKERKYHHSWIVRGHWRKLHEPRKKDGAVASWIESYVKGVGPLLQPREPIFSVSR